MQTCPEKLKNVSSAIFARSFNPHPISPSNKKQNVSVLPRLGGKGRGEGKMRTMTGGKTEGKRTRIGAKFGTRWEIVDYVPQ